MKFKLIHIILILAAVAVIACLFYKPLILGFRAGVSKPCNTLMNPADCLQCGNINTCGWCPSSATSGTCMDVTIADNGYKSGICPKYTPSQFAAINGNDNICQYNEPGSDAYNKALKDQGMVNVSSAYTQKCNTITDKTTCDSKSVCSWCGVSNICVDIEMNTPNDEMKTGMRYTSHGDCKDDTTLGISQIVGSGSGSGSGSSGSGPIRGSSGSGSSGSGPIRESSGSGSGSKLETTSESDVPCEYLNYKDSCIDTNGCTWCSNSEECVDAKNGCGDTEPEPGSESTAVTAPVSSITSGSSYADLVQTVLEKSGLAQQAFNEIQNRNKMNNYK